MSACVLAVGAGLDKHFLDPGSLWIGVAVDQAHDVRAISRELGADHELDGFARLNSEVIGIPDDAPFHEVVGNFAPNRHIRRVYHGPGKWSEWRPGLLLPSLGERVDACPGHRGGQATDAA